MRLTAAWRRAAIAIAAIAATATPAVLAATPAYAAWGVQYSVTIQVNGAGQTLGYASGWVQFDTGGSTTRYEFTVCRQSSYTPPDLEVAVNTHVVAGQYVNTRVAYHHGSYGGVSAPAPCYSGAWNVSGQFTYANHYNVEFTLFGDTFTNGNNYTVFDQDRTINNPY